MGSVFLAYANRDNDTAQQVLQRHAPEENDQGRFEWWLMHHLTKPPEAAEFASHQGAAREVCYVASSNLVVSAGDDGMIRVSNATDGSLRYERKLGGRLDALAISPDGETICHRTKFAARLESSCLR